MQDFYLQQSINTLTKVKDLSLGSANVTKVGVI